MATTTGGNKILMWCLGALSSISSYVAYIQNKRVEDVEKSKQTNEVYYKAALLDKDRIIVIERRQKDSLQGLLLTRTDKSFEELKNLMEIKSKSSTITIKPKRNR